MSLGPTWAFGSDRARSLRSRLSLVLVTVVTLALVGLHSWWLWQFRRGYPLNYDEAAFLSMACYDTLGLRAAGVFGLARGFLVQGPAAPLVPLLTVPIQLAFGEQILPSFLVVQGFFVLLVFASYGIGSRLTDAPLGALTAIVVATAPGVTEYARMYHFAVPSAALYTAAIYALLRSDGLRHHGWVLTWGVLLGLMVLTRTVMLAVVPGLILAAAVQLTGAGGRRRRAIHLGLGLVAGLLMAATWYWRNLLRVAEYLLASGYGEHSELHGVARSVATWEFWAARLSNLVQQGTYVPLAVCLLGVVLSGLISAALGPRRPAGRAGRMPLHRGDVLAVVVVLAGGYLALTSSRNVGSGFVLVLLPVSVSLAIVALTRVPARPWRALLTGGLVLVAGGNVLMHTPLLPGLAEPRAVEVAGLGDHPVTDGRADIQKILAQAGHDPGAPSSRIPPLHRDWLRVDHDLAVFLSELAAAHGRRPVAWFASRDSLFNISSVRLAGLLHLRQDISMGQLSGLPAGDSADAYRTALATAPVPPNFLIAAEPGPGEFPPYVTQEYAEAAGRSLGFDLARTFWLPGGREVRVWWLDQGPRLSEQSGAREASGALTLR